MAVKSYHLENEKQTDLYVYKKNIHSYQSDWISTTNQQ